jgi:hypothetical protein
LAKVLDEMSARVDDDTKGSNLGAAEEILRRLSALRGSPPLDAAPSVAPVLDLMAALKASLAAEPRPTESPTPRGLPSVEAMAKHLRDNESGRRDLNPRPPEPH